MPTALLVATAAAAIPPGTLDTRFGFNGATVVHFDEGGTLRDSAEAAALFPDGRVAVAGSVDTGVGGFDFGVTVLFPDGSLDSSFGGDGRVTVGFDLGGTLGDFVTAVAVQADGKIVVAGSVAVDPTPNLDFGVVRLNADGSLDTSFDGDGRAVIPFDVFGSLQDLPQAIALQADGKILVAGFADTDVFPANDEDFAVARLNSDGSLDLSFDGDGKALISFGPGRDNAYGLLVQSDGKIVVSGEVSNETFDFGVARLNSDGSLDTSFSGDGKAAASFGMGNGQDQGKAVAQDGSGRLVVVGSVSNGTDWDFGIVRFLPNGTLDSTFDGDGLALVAFDLGEDSDIASEVAITEGGGIVVAGRAFRTPSNTDYAIARLTENGGLDTAFGTAGKTVIAFDLGQDNRDEANALVIRPDSRLLVAGTVERSQSGDTDFGIVQLVGDRIFADGFESGDLSAWSGVQP
ncbi:MAG: hypothetical protein KDD47_17825 [Acidobacteria bacterium]|nr:hypothetical protein [Acidobacteriota bacterium]